MTEDRRALSAGLDQVEKYGASSKIGRFIKKPMHYSLVILHRKIQYKFLGREKQVKCKTFFNEEMHLSLPSSTDIFLSGGKTHDSEVRLARYFISEVKAGEVFFDIGAHCGYFSLLASRLVGEEGSIVAFEASPKTHQMLCQNLSQRSNAEIHHRAVSDTNGTVKFYEFPNLYSEYNAIDAEQYKDQNWFKKHRPVEANVQAVTLDFFVRSHSIIPTTIKIDVEGAEYKVLSGSKNVLAKHSPTIAMEYLSPRRNNQNHVLANNLLLDLGYSAHIIDSKGLLQKTRDLDEHMRTSGLESDNAVFKPA
ncbi:MAG: FkbM family methyltransferase [Saprospirales bacterium]|nr:MAG: FkbM family methyltransferase [Saprospirales bacterium]